MGLSLADTAATSTVRPAALMEMAGQIGSLEDGACADVAVFRQEERTEVL